MTPGARARTVVVGLALFASACASEGGGPDLERSTGSSGQGAGTVVDGGGAAIEAPTGLRVEDAWVRTTPAGLGAAYFTIDGGPVADRLLSVSASIARSAELHATQLEGDTMKMRPVDGLEVPAGATLTLEPDGTHVMLFDVAGATGEYVSLTLVFERAGAIEVPAAIRAP